MRKLLNKAKSNEENFNEFKMFLMNVKAFLTDRYKERQVFMKFRFAFKGVGSV